MTKDEARDAAWAWMDSRVDGTLDSGHDYFDNGFDAGYDFAKSNDKAVIDGFLARVRDELKKGYFTREQIVSLDLIFNIVAAEMFGKEGE